MPTRLQLQCLGLLCLLPLTALAGERAKSIANPYKLQLNNASDYRMQARGEHTLLKPTPPELATRPYAREIEAAAHASRLDPVLVHALINVESGYRSDAVSNRGAVGLMQVLPATALRFGIANPAGVKNNLRAGTRYLRWLLDRFDGRIDLALSAYNAGEGVVDHYQDIPPFAETRHYVPAVLAIYSNWRPQSQAHYLQATVRDYQPITRPVSY